MTDLRLILIAYSLGGFFGVIAGMALGIVIYCD